MLCRLRRGGTDIARRVHTGQHRRDILLVTRLTALAIAIATATATTSATTTSATFAFFTLFNRFRLERSAWVRLLTWFLRLRRLFRPTCYRCGYVGWFVGTLLACFIRAITIIAWSAFLALRARLSRPAILAVAAFAVAVASITTRALAISAIA